ncbi:septum site-determining protein MinC [secondary endosymbiont of Heteropsylla cubana]|uniref:Probable septum site-determining protein MinC n=1 Tax=secondary endosymbiont of Heteropsylla cubana TaxID=134287 RepID=J3TZ47_9ENTR|nr:septum site-determining protein MinC [secondary endosymbiont of Heteropsylla cubana]AFP85735.1 septum site-determining protein MinC [secondary endosymbiont of Heteropsylla cubana]
MLKRPIEFKGSNFTLSVIHLYNTQTEEIRLEIEKKLKQAPDFLKNAPVVINVSALDGDTSWKTLFQAVLQTGLHVIGVTGCKNSNLKKEIIGSGLAILTEFKAEQYRASISSSMKTSIKTLTINLPVRSGQQIYARNSDLIVTGNVSAGAELVADGNIHIYGVMRGRALAGASGDRKCQIFCIHLFAELVSIAGQYWLSDQIPTSFSGKAARLYLESNILTIHPLL